jgi:ribosomal protein S18 acetylase RimI-like enzyme
MDNIKIRRAKSSDIDALMPQILIFEEQHAVYDGGYLTDKYRENAKEDLKRDIKKKYFWVAELNKKVIGFVKAEISDFHSDRLIIDDLFVEADFRKQGIGAKLISYVEESFKKEKGIKEACLWVAKQNINAEGFYKGLGFKFQEDIWKKYLKEL